MPGRTEKIAGQAYTVELDPRDRRNAIIQDIQLAPKNSRGMVEYVAMFTLTKACRFGKDEQRVMVYSVVNRGRNIDPGAATKGICSWKVGGRAKFLPDLARMARFP